MFFATGLAACGGGDSSNQGFSGTGLDKVVSFFNYGSGVTLESTTSTILLDDNFFSYGTGCDSNVTIDKSSVEPFVVSESTNGVCVNDGGVVECVAINQNTALTHIHGDLVRRLFTVKPSEAYTAEVLINNNAFEIDAMSQKEDCTRENVPADWANPDGVYTGNIYSFGSNLNNETGQATISREFTLTCTS
jgi:hypothetical protein